MPLHPALRNHARVGARELLRVANRPGQRDDEQQERDRRQRTHAPRKRAERRNEREHVAVEVRAQGQQIGEVDDDERREDEVGTGPVYEREDEADSADDQDGAEPFPQPAGERDRRDVVVLEAEPAFTCQALHAERFVPRPGDGARG